MPSTPCFLPHVHLQTHLTSVTMATMSQPSYASGVSEVPLLGETIGANLRRTIRAYGDREALVEVQTGRRWTYDEFGAEVELVARGLLARGIAKGDRVGIWAPNQAEWTITQYATALIGAILVNINPAYRTHELSYALNQSGVRLLVSATEFKTSDYRAMVDEVKPDCAALEQIVYLGTGDWDGLRDDASRIPLDGRATDHLVDHRAVVAGLERLRRHEQLHTGLVEHVGELVGPVRRVDRHQDRADLRGRVLRDRPLGAVGRPDADPVPLRHPRAEQAGGERVDVTVEVGVGPPSPARELDERLAVTVRCDGALEVGADGLLEERRGRLAAGVGLHVPTLVTCAAAEEGRPCGPAQTTLRGSSCWPVGPIWMSVPISGQTPQS